MAAVKIDEEETKLPEPPHAGAGFFFGNVWRRTRTPGAAKSTLLRPVFEPAHRVPSLWMAPTATTLGVVRVDGTCADTSVFCEQRDTLLEVRRWRSAVTYCALLQQTVLDCWDGW